MSSRLPRPPARVRIGAAAALCLVALASCSTEDAGQDDVATDPEPTEVTSEATSESPSESPSESGGTEPAACEYPEDGQPPATEVEPPPAEATATGPVTVEIATSAGLVSAELDGAATPCTVNSFLSLAEQGYFDDTECHRLTTQGIFVLQCGDPTATGTGGPGYSFPDELTGEETYPAGTLAMANAGPNTNGSQFFVVYDDTQLNPAYTVFGTIDAPSVQVVQDVAAEGSDEANGPGDGAPNEQVVIESVTVSQP